VGRDSALLLPRGKELISTILENQLVEGQRKEGFNADHETDGNQATEIRVKACRKEGKRNEIGVERKN